MLAREVLRMRGKIICDWFFYRDLKEAEKEEAIVPVKQTYEKPVEET